MKTSEAGRQAIKKFEGVRLTAYPDPATGGEPWTIGVGHTGGVKPGDTITEAQADEYLIADLADAEKAVNRVLVPLTQNQYDSLTSFVFNVGSGNFLQSTLLKKLEKGDYEGASEQFKFWDVAAGRHMPGLLKRRLAEASIFRGES